MSRETYRGDSRKNPVPYTPTFYGVDRRKRLQKHLVKVNGRRRKEK